MKKVSIDIALPVYYGNIPEVRGSVKAIREYCEKNLREYKWTIIIAVNGKQPEKIVEVAKELKKKYRGKVDYIYTPHPGKGYGILEAWSKRKVDVHTYMDIDLSTGLEAFKPMVKEIEKGYAIVGGSRYHPQSRITRSLKRYIISKGYTLFFYRWILGVPFRDPQCGFKAVTEEIVEKVVPEIKDKVWFWESEMVYIAYKKGMSIKEIPVVWTERKISGVNLIKIIPDFIKNVFRMKHTRI